MDGMDGTENADDVAGARHVGDVPVQAPAVGDVPVQTLAGEWRPDPMRRAPMRQLTEQGWGPWLSDGHTVWLDQRPVRRSLVPPDLAAIQFVDEVFVPEARARGLLPAELTGLRGLLDELAAEATHGQAPRNAPAAPVAPVGPPRRAPRAADPFQVRGPQRSAAPAMRPASNPMARPVARPATRPASLAADQAAAARRRARRAWWDRTRASLGSDLGVHGLAYLGVLLLFVGMFGLVAFAFGDVTPGLRPVAEAMAALVPFAAARLLIRDGVTVVGRSLEVVGGLLVPIMLITSMVDGNPVPPDPRGSALVIALTMACLAWAAVCALWSRRHPASGLRFAVAPTTWFAAAAATIALARPMPSGQDVAIPSSHQLTAVAAALVLTLALARRWPGHRLAAPTLVAGVPGLLIVVVLAALTWAADGRPRVPVVLTGVLVLVALELLRPRLPDRLVDVVAPMWWGVVALMLVSKVSAGLLAAGAAVGFIVLLEAVGRRRGANWALLLSGLGLTVSLTAVWADPWWAVGALTASAVWAVLRRLRPYDDAAPWLDVAAAILPAAAVVALGVAQSAAVGVMGATAVVAAATLPAGRPLLRRTDDDLFWRTWWRWSLPVVAVAALAESAGTETVVRWQMVGCLAALALIALVGPLSATARTWSVTALAVTAWVLGCAVGSVPDPVRGGVLVAAALAMVVAGRSPVAVVSSLAAPVIVGRSPTAPVALVGHLLAVASMGLSGIGWGLVAAVGVGTAGWVVTAIRDDRSPLGWLGVGANPLRYLPWAVVSMGLPLTVSLALDAGGVLPLFGPWAVAVLAGAAVGYAAVTRFTRPGRLRVVAAWAAFAAGVFAVALSWRPWPAIVSLAALIGAVVLLPAGRRAAPMRWTAWVAVAPLAGMLAWQTVPWFAALPLSTAVAMTLGVLGGALAIGSAAVDPRAVLARPGARRRTLDAPWVVGAVEVAGALALASGVVPMPDAGWVTLGVAVVVLTVAVLTGVGSLAGGAIVIAWVAMVRLSWPELDARPWVSVVVVVALLLGAEAAHRLTAERRPWRRWDVSLLVVATPVAATALVAAADTAAASTPDRGAFVATYAAIGVLVVAVAVRLRHLSALAEVLGWVGAALILTAAARAGTGWLALGFLALAAVQTGLAVRATGVARPIRQLLGVLSALMSWGVALSWFAWATQQSVDVTAAGAGGVALLAAGVAWWRRIDRSWVLVWGGAAVAVVATTATACSGAFDASVVGAVPSWWVVLGLVAVAAAAGSAALPLRLTGLRDLAAATALAVVVMSLQVADASPGTRVIALSALAAGLAAITLVLARRPSGREWTRALVELGVGAAVVALMIGLGSDPILLVPAVAAIAVQVGAAGVALRSVGLQMASPAIACVAWLLFVANGDDRAPQWYTMAIGLALLAVVAVWRHDQRLREENPATGPVIGLELAGIAFLVVSSLVQAVTVSLLHALVAIGLGVAVAAWGLATRVRRRVAAGVVVVGVAVVLLVAVPLVRMVPTWRGATVWLMLAGIGLVAVLVATMLERGRTAARGALGRVNEVTAGWE